LQAQQAAQMAAMQSQQAQAAQVGVTSATNDVTSAQNNLDQINQQLAAMDSSSSGTDGDRAKLEEKKLEAQAAVERAQGKLEVKQKEADSALAAIERPEETVKRHVAEGQKELIDLASREVRAKNKLLEAQEDLKEAEKDGDPKKIERAKIAVMEAQRELDAIVASKEEAQGKIAHAEEKLETPEQRKNRKLEDAISNLDALKKQQAQAKQGLDDADQALQKAISAGDDITVQQAKEAKKEAIRKYDAITKKVREAQALVDGHNKIQELKKEETHKISTDGVSLQKAREEEIKAARKLIQAQRGLQLRKQQERMTRLSHGPEAQEKLTQ
jgi:hypothetical protein